MSLKSPHTIAGPFMLSSRARTFSACNARLRNAFDNLSIRFDFMLRISLRLVRPSVSWTYSSLSASVSPIDCKWIFIRVNFSVSIVSSNDSDLKECSSPRCRFNRRMGYFDSTVCPPGEGAMYGYSAFIESVCDDDMFSLPVVMDSHSWSATMSGLALMMHSSVRFMVTF